jgi:hypothetical protein
VDRDRVVILTLAFGIQTIMSFVECQKTKTHAISPYDVSALFCQFEIKMNDVSAQATKKMADEAKREERYDLIT